MKPIVFFNNKGGVGKTSLVYHLAWMYADLGVSVLVADLDPQANLTSMFVSDEALEELWPDGHGNDTIYGAIQPLLDGTGDVRLPELYVAGPKLALVVGDLRLSASEDEMSSQWPECLEGRPRAFRVMSALWRVLELAARDRAADLVLIDVGPNLGALNRAALVTAEHVVVPLAPDLYSLQGLRNLGPTLERWRHGWEDRLKRRPDASISLPSGQMRPAGYIVMQHAVRLDRPVKAYEKWIARIPGEYRVSVLRETGPSSVAVGNDPHCLATLKHYRSLMPLAQEARKPMFYLRSADGAVGSHQLAVQECYRDFGALARRVADKCGIAIP